MCAGLVDAAAICNSMTVRCASVMPLGQIVQDGIEPEDDATYIGEATLRNSYLKAPYYKPAEYPDGVYRVGPLARINTAEQFGTPKADVELREFRQRFGRMAHSAFHYHYARLLEMTYVLERMQQLLDLPAISTLMFAPKQQ